MVAEAYNTYALYQSGFIIAPLVYFASVVVAAAMLPNFGTQFSFGDIFVFIGVLTLGRFYDFIVSGYGYGVWRHGRIP